MPDKSRTQDMRLSFSNAPRFDQSPQLVPVMDSNNVVLSPDGSEARNRPGSEIRNVYRCVTNPVGRKAIIIESNPPDVDLGKMFMVVNTANNQNVIEQIEFVNNRADSGGNTINSTVSFEVDSVYVNQVTNIAVTPQRSGNLDGVVTVQYETADGTAIAGVNYTAASGTLTYLSGAHNPTANLNTTIIGPEADKYYYIYLKNPGSTLGLGTYSRLTVISEI